MKNSKFGQFLKKNGAALFSICGILVIAVAVMFIVNGSIKESEPAPDQEYRIDLNEMEEGDNTEDSSLLAQEETEHQDMPQVAQNETESNELQAADSNRTKEPETEATVEGNDVTAEDAADDRELTAENRPVSDMPPAEVAENTAAEEPEFRDEAQAASSTGSSVEQKDAVDLFFEEGMEILWPVEGNVVMNYSDDHLIYHTTLDQFRTHDAIAIAAEIGTEVVAAADGVVASIEDSVQTGVTVTTAIGNDYYLVYGQLESSELKVGDSVSRGEVIGTVAEVSRFYSKEGDNLYFQVRCGEETLNPMSLLGRADETEAAVNEESEAVETTVPEE